MIPCMMMVLGAVLYKGPGRANVAPRLILGVAFVRLLLIPLLGARPPAALPLTPAHAKERTTVENICMVVPGMQGHAGEGYVAFARGPCLSSMHVFLHK